MSTEITFDREPDNRYTVLRDGMAIGLLRQSSRRWTLEVLYRVCSIPAHELRAIADKLDELNGEKSQ